MNFNDDGQRLALEREQQLRQQELEREREQHLRRQELEREREQHLRQQELECENRQRQQEGSMNDRTRDHEFWWSWLRTFWLWSGLGSASAKTAPVNGGRKPSGQRRR